MERVLERTEQNTISVRTKSNKYYEARISLKIGGGKSERLQKGSKEQDLAVLKLLKEIEIFIDSIIKSGVLTFKINQNLPTLLVKSINTLQITNPEVMEKTLLIVNKINNFNSTFDNIININNNIVPFPTPPNNTTNVVAPVSVTSNNYNLENSNTSNKKQKICVIEDLADEWHLYRLSLCKKTEDNPDPLSQKTIDSDYVRLRDEILPYFKENKILYLSQITDEWIKSLLKSLKSQHSKNKSYIVLNMLFKYAIQNNKATINPLEKVDKPPEKVSTGEEEIDDNYIEPENQDVYLDKFEEINTDMSILFETMLLTGIRPEEACGLKWKALDLENNELIINNAYKDFIKYDENGKKIGHYRSDDKLKTQQSYRRIPLNPRLREVLLKHKEEQQKLFKKSRAIKDRHRVWSENEYMFLGRNYHPYVSETLSSALPKLCDEYKLKRISPYGLRHSFATYCSEHGMEEIVLMKLMGHSNFETTQKYYIKVSAKRKRLAMQEAYKVVFYERKAS